VEKRKQPVPAKEGGKSSLTSQRKGAGVVAKEPLSKKKSKGKLSSKKKRVQEVRHRSAHKRGWYKRLVEHGKTKEGDRVCREERDANLGKKGALTVLERQRETT